MPPKLLTHAPLIADPKQVDIHSFYTLYMYALFLHKPSARAIILNKGYRIKNYPNIDIKAMGFHWLEKEALWQ